MPDGRVVGSAILVKALGENKRGTQAFSQRNRSADEASSMRDVPDTRKTLGESLDLGSCLVTRLKDRGYNERHH
jgi:hypothetical protein